jgi:hypothetical protein
MPSTRQPVLLEVLTQIPSDFFHCLHCEQLFDVAGIGAEVHRVLQANYPPKILEDAGRLAVLLQEPSARNANQNIQLIDPQSLEGFLKSIRYWIRRYPSFIINHRVKYIGWDAGELACLIADGVSSTEGSQA